MLNFLVLLSIMHKYIYLFLKYLLNIQRFWISNMNTYCTLLFQYVHVQLKKTPYYLIFKLLDEPYSPFMTNNQGCTVLLNQH